MRDYHHDCARAALADPRRRDRPGLGAGEAGLPVGSIGILTRIWQAAKLLTDERRRTLARVHLDAATLDLLTTLRRSGPPYRLSTRELSAPQPDHGRGGDPARGPWA